MVDSNRYREVMGSFATGVTVVATRTDDGDHGMTVNSFTSVSIDPPLVLFNADKETDTHDLVADSGLFSVNVLAKNQEWLSNRFAGEHKDMDDPFNDIEVRRESTGAPIITGTLAYLDCDLETAYDGGDHTIYVGRIQDLGVQDGAAQPLTFFRGEYGTIESDG